MIPHSIVLAFSQMIVAFLRKRHLKTRTKKRWSCSGLLAACWMLLMRSTLAPTSSVPLAAAAAELAERRCCVSFRSMVSDIRSAAGLERRSHLTQPSASTGLSVLTEPVCPPARPPIPSLSACPPVSPQPLLLDSLPVVSAPYLAPSFLFQRPPCQSDPLWCAAPGRWRRRPEVSLRGDSYELVLITGSTL